MNVSRSRHSLHAAVLLGLLSVALYLPYAVFGVIPITRQYEVSAEQRSALLAGLDLPDYYATTPVAVSPEEELARKSDFLWCSFCHTLKAGEKHRVGPNLYRIMGQPAGAVRNFAYSGSFLAARDNGMVWTPETLDSFLLAPHDYVPGNRMRFQPIADPEQRQRIIAKLIETTR